MDLIAPPLFPYEVMNALLKAIRRGRLSPEDGREMMDIFQELGIPVAEAPRQRVWELAYNFHLSSYDGSYLALAEARETDLLTGDHRLYNAVRDRLSWVHWIEDVVF